MVILAMGGFVLFIIWVAMLWRPLWSKPPEEFDEDAEKAPNKILQAMGVVWIKEKMQPLLTTFKEMGIRNIVKIGFSFFQILGSFPNTFTVKWPSVM